MTYSNAMELFSVQGKITFITGSTRGLGLAFAQGYADAGAKVVINGRNPESVATVTETFRQNGKDVFGYAFDVCDEAAVNENIARIENDVGPIEVLINNVGIQQRSPLVDMPLESWKKVIDTNLTAPFVVSKAVAKSMIEYKRGKIIYITSLTAEGARPTTGNYCAAKGGLKMLMKAMATELGRHNIQVNAIGPGYFKTDLNRDLIADPEFNAWVLKKVSLGRWGEPEELIGTAIFLASKASDYINGQTIYVDGGWLAAL